MLVPSDPTEIGPQYPDCYLHVTEHCSGQEWIMPIGPRAGLNLSSRVKEWIRREYGSECRLDGKIGPSGLDGQFYARIMTDGRPPSSIVCWSSGGFYIKPSYEG